MSGNTPEVTGTIYDNFSVYLKSAAGDIHGVIAGECNGRLLIEENPPNYYRRIITISETYLHRLGDLDRTSPIAYFRARPTLKYLKVFSMAVIDHDEQ